MPRSVFWVNVNGAPITSMLEPILLSIEITDSDGGKSDTLEIDLDDTGGFIEMPPTNAPIEAGIGYEDDYGNLTAPPVMFSGKVDQPTSTFGRGQGLTLRISAKSADVKGKAKEHKDKHHDKGKFSEVAKKWGKAAGYNVTVADGIDLERDYWSMQGESFYNWGKRTAQELNATFKARNGEATFTKRSSGTNAQGQALPPVYATYGKNIISGTISPTDDRQTWEKFKVRFFDPKKSKYIYEDAEAKTKGGTAGHLNRFHAADSATAKRRGEANATESDRNKGGGTITIDGDSAAQSEAPCIVANVRPSVDGTYKIKVARHRLTRKAGWTVEMQLVQPGDDTKDDRGNASK